MQLERWQQIEQLFHLTLEQEPAQRATFLAEACEGDDALRSEIESLINSHEEGESFIEAPAADLAAELLAKGQVGIGIGHSIGPYKVRSVLGIGGMGEVYLAQDTRLGRQVALKLLPALFTADSDRVRRFEQEARAASALNHPNIVTIHEIGQIEGTQFIVTEFVDGQTLRQLLAETEISLDEALDVAIQIASALQAAHSAGIVHRDIKPENIMLRSDGYLKILDFGLAKLTERPSPSVDTEAATPAPVKTSPGMVMGTVQYMSPEQARGTPVDARTDIWSLGVVLYELLSGHVPFQGETPSHVIISILEKDPVPPASSLQVPAELERILSKALRKNRDERYQTANELADDLNSLRQELEVDERLKRADRLPASGEELTMSGGSRQAVENSKTSAGQTADVAAPRPTLSVEYLISEMKQHKKSTALASLVMVLVVASFAYFFYFKGGGKLLAKSGEPIEPSTSNAPMKSIAVLPFKPLVGESRNESLELGMADTLINKLSPIRQLIVRPISDVRKYTSLEQNPIAAGRELGVDYVLEGNLQMVGEKTRVTVRLLSVKDERAVWTDKCDEQCNSIFELQDAIAERIPGMLALRLTGDEKRQLAKHYTENAEAYRLYSLGVYSGQGRAPAKERIEKSIEYFEQAIKVDPNYALAYCKLSKAYALLGLRGFRPPQEAREKYEWAALKAVELDDTLAEAHAALAVVKKTNWDWAGAEREFKRALELDPNSFDVNFSYVPFLVDVGRLDEALVYAKQTDELGQSNPLYLNSQQAYVYFHMRQYDKGIELWLKVKERNPNRAPMHFRLGESYLGKGMYKEAIAKMQEAVAFDNDPQRWNGYPILAYAYAVAGRRDEALEILDEQKELAKHSYISPYNFAIIYTGLGDKDRAFESLEKAYQERSEALTHFKSRPMFDSLRSDPRYPELLRKMNLAP